MDNNIESYFTLLCFRRVVPPPRVAYDCRWRGLWRAGAVFSHVPVRPAVAQRTTSVCPRLGTTDDCPPRGRVAFLHRLPRLRFAIFRQSASECVASMVASADDGTQPDLTTASVKLLTPSYRAQLGECPVWVPEDVDRPDLVGGVAGVLLSIDITGPHVLRLNADGSVRKWTLPNWCGIGARGPLSESALLVVAVQRGIRSAHSPTPLLLRRVGCIALRKGGGLVAGITEQADHSGGALFGVTLPVLARHLKAPLNPAKAPPVHTAR